MPWTTTLRRRPVRRSRAGRPTLRVLFSPSRGLTVSPPVELSEGVTRLGRSVEGDGIELSDDPYVSRHHLDLHVTEGRARLVNQSSGGTVVNGSVVDERALSDGDVLRVGDTFLVHRAPHPSVDDVAIPSLIGDAPAMRALRHTLDLVARSNATVLLLGETGTGKELAARAIHEASGRSGPFVAVNCAAVPESLAESQLFGHVAGSFTGAKRDSEGYFRRARGGTLLLDEIGDLPATLQPKLLRALEERAVVPLGETEPIECDTRVLAATLPRLVEDVETGRFRGDLFARLSEFTIELPPLRERAEDVLPILASALDEGVARELEPDLVAALLFYAWPFNVRELVKVATRLGLRARGAAALGLEHLDGDALGPTGRLRLGGRPRHEGDDLEPAPPPAASSRRAETWRPPPPSRGVPEPDELLALLREHNGVVADVARVTGRSRKQVYRWMRKHGIDASDYRPDD